MIFRWASWYVWGWCREKEDFRLFKLNRMEKVTLGTDRFERKKVPMPDLSDERVFRGGIHVKVLFEAECKWRLVEEYGMESFEEQEDGRLLFQADYTDKENLLTWLMTFRDKAVLLEPEEVRRELNHSFENIRKKYEWEG